MNSDVLQTVFLLGVPLRLLEQSQEHMADLLRELQLIAMSTHSLQAMPAHHREIPARLLTLIDETSARYAGFTQATDSQRDLAIAAGDQTVDLTFRLPPELADVARALWAGLDELDEFCRSGGYLLTLETPPPLVALRHWYLGELAEQLETGRPPVAWADFAARAAVEI